MRNSVQAQKKGELDEARGMVEQAMRLARQFPPGEMKLAQTHIRMAEVFRSLDKTNEAETHYKNAITHAERIVGPRHPSMVTPLESLANFYFYSSPPQHAKAAEMATRIKGIVENALRQTEQELTARAHNLGEVYLLLGDYEQAEREYKQAADLAERGGYDAPFHLGELAKLYTAWGKHEAAITVAQRGLAIRERELRPEASLTEQVSPLLNLTMALDVLGEAYLAAGQAEAAAEVYSRAVETTERVNGKQSTDLAPRLLGLARSLRGSKQADAAKADCERAIALVEGMMGKDAPDLLPYLEEQELILIDLKEDAAAEKTALRIKGIAAPDA